VVRYLTVMRHAKSAWSAGFTNDHARPLNARGRRDAPRIAAELVQRQWEPELVLGSDSARTRETWARMADQLPEAAACFTPELYHAGVDPVRRLLQALPSNRTRVLLLGHNPGFEDVVDWLAGHTVRLTTANAALLQAEGPSWADALEPGAWTLHTVLRPKELSP
jgi:phosphohistidine phosphatase